MSKHTLYRKFWYAKIEAKLEFKIAGLLDVSM